MTATATPTKKRRRRDTPLERTRALPPADPAVTGEPEFGPEPVQPSAEWVTRREIQIAHYAALGFEARVLHALAVLGVVPPPVQFPPLRVPPPITVVDLLVAYVEAHLVERAMFPGEFVRADVDEADPPDEDLIDADRLSIVPPPRHRPARDCILPGCQGRAADGSRCLLLRARGDRYCPGCERKARRQMKAR